jgi:VanZ family protein
VRPPVRNLKEVPVPERLKRATRIAAWLAIAALAVVSLLPASLLVRTELGGGMEHMLAYLGTALLTALAYDERGSVRPLALLLAYAAVLEYLQRFSPGRHSQLNDFLFSAAGVMIGIAGFTLLKALQRREGKARG